MCARLGAGVAPRPGVWHQAEVTMLPKEAPIRSAGRLRPITLLCGLDKLWNKAFLDRTPELGGEADLTLGF
eukprot:9399861-Prorocentrum_lima.AAC.1